MTDDDVAEALKQAKRAANAVSDHTTPALEAGLKAASESAGRKLLPHEMCAISKLLVEMAETILSRLPEDMRSPVSAHLAVYILTGGRVMK